MIKVALTGTHGVGKSTMVSLVARTAVSRGWAVEVVNSPTRYLKSLGKPYGLANNKDSDGQLEMMNLALMRLRGWEAERRLIALEDQRLNVPRKTLVIGDRCTLDVAAYLQDLVFRAEWKYLASPEEVRIRHRLVDTSNLALPFALTDVSGFWDAVCYKPPHPDHLTADPDRLDDRRYQLDVDRQICSNFDRLQQIGGPLTHTLDKDLYRAADQVWKIITEIDATQTSLEPSL